jgi:hypothetical protein
VNLSNLNMAKFSHFPAVTTKERSKRGPALAPAPF